MIFKKKKHKLLLLKSDIHNFDIGIYISLNLISVSDKMVFAPLIDASVAIFILIALAQYAKIRDKSERGYNWLAAGGVIILFAALFSVAPAFGSAVGLSTVWNNIGDIFQIIGWLFALVGVAFVAYETVIEK